MRERVFQVLACALLFVVTIAIPMAGAWMTLARDDARWMWLMVPLIVYHEASVGLGIIMFLIALVGLGLTGGLP